MPEDDAPDGGPDRSGLFAAPPNLQQLLKACDLDLAHVAAVGLADELQTLKEEIGEDGPGAEIAAWWEPPDERAVALAVAAFGASWCLKTQSGFDRLMDQAAFALAASRGSRVRRAGLEAGSVTELLWRLSGWVGRSLWFSHPLRQLCVLHIQAWEKEQPRRGDSRDWSPRPPVAPDGPGCREAMQSAPAGFELGRVRKNLAWFDRGDVLCGLRAEFAKATAFRLSLGLDNRGDGKAPAPSKVVRDGSLEARALAMTLEHPDWTNAEMAKHLGCHEKSLSRFPHYSRARRDVAGDRQQVRRGWRGKGGAVDGLG
jgi:hypothetical protein